MSYKIKCYITELSSDGTIKLRGLDGYHLSKDDDKLNVFWNESDNTDLKTFEEDNEFNVTPLKSKSENNIDILQMLLSAKANSQKVELSIENVSKSEIKISKISLV